MESWIHDSTDSYGLAFLIAALANVVSIGFVAGLQASSRRTVPMAVTPA